MRFHHYLTVSLSFPFFLSTVSAVSLRRETKENSQVQSRIVGGFDAEEGRYPYMASLEQTRGRMVHVCGATLIAPSILLTAAHCFQGADDWLKVVLNPYSISNPSKDAVRYQILESRIHPEWTTPYQFSNDFMLVRIDGASSIPPVRLNTNASLPVAGDHMTTVGWGTTAYGTVNPPPGGVLQVDRDGKFIENEPCDAVYTSDDITPDMMCVRSDRTCQGDSGGPTMAEGADASEDVQYGITSFGIACRSSVYPGVYARVSYRWNWIRRNACDMANGNVPDYFDCPGQSYAPSEEGALAPTASPAPTNSPVLITIRFFTDAYPVENSWQLRNADNQVIDERTIGQITEQNAMLDYEIVVNDFTDLRLIIKDAGRDGICCRWGDGNVTVYFGTERTGFTKVLAQTGGKLGAQITLTFDAQDSPAPVTPLPTTSAPTRAPVTNSPVTPAPTKAPVTPAPSEAPVTPAPTNAPVTPNPTNAPVTPNPTTQAPLETPGPTPEPTKKPTTAPTTTPSLVPTAMTTSEPSALPTFTTSCDPVPQGGCSVCGRQLCVTVPNFVVEIQSQPSARCGEIEAAGLLGQLPPEACQLLPTLDYFTENCGCSTGTSEPSASPSLSPSISPSASPTYPLTPVVFTVVVNTDGYPDETSWSLQEKSAKIIARTNFGDLLSPEAPVSQQVQLRMGTRYTFILYDKYGDGFCCRYGQGNAEIYFGVEIKPEALLVKVDGNFTQATYVDFIAQDPAVSGPGRVVDDIKIIFCFPGDSLCEVEGRGQVLMRDLQLGDKVLVGGGEYEPIYSFGHSAAEVIGDYVQLVTSSTTLELSKDHMVFVNGGRSVPASNVKIGDRLVLADGGATSVKDVRNVMRKGAYAPFTPSGTVIVNGVKASSFIAFQNAETLKISGFDTRVTFQFLAHTFEGPHRIWCQYFGSCKSERYSEGGISVWVYMPYKAGLWLLEQGPVTMGLLSVPVLLFFGIMAYPLSFLCTVLAIVAATTRCSVRFKRSA